jgi:hypothetical protein
MSRLKSDVQREVPGIANGLVAKPCPAAFLRMCGLSLSLIAGTE